ncbi:MAG: hypothetical protein GF334_11570 [Candidatus Altiarchaeales archaeon]|nr:hypothetical protein [Candidatus Altiarchaeales archaeon]
MYSNMGYMSNQVNSNVVVLVLAAVIVVLLMYVGFDVMQENAAKQEQTLKRQYEQGFKAGQTQMSSRMLSQIRSQGFAPHVFETENGSMAVNLIIQPSKEQVDAIYFEGFNAGRNSIANDMFSKLNSQGYVDYNFTYEGQLYPVRLVPVQQNQQNQ